MNTIRTFNIVLRNVRKRYDYEELIKIFLHDDEFEIYALEQKKQGEFITPEELEAQVADLDNKLEFELKGDTKADKNILKSEIFDVLSEVTGIRPPWGSLTGVRPVKLCGMLDNPLEELTGLYRVSDYKAEEIIDIYNYQQSVLDDSNDKTLGIYIGIPFCPTRCLYCSFTSNQPKGDALDRYLEALIHEIEYCGRKIKEQGLYVESIYIGGGTPTTLDSIQLKRLLTAVEEHIGTTKLKEYTVEAGRPDTIDRDKLQVIRNHGVDRISINPQTMKAETLEIIGRSHSPEDIERAFEDAETIGVPVINADLIAGLQDESPEDFRRSLNKVIEMGANNITVHSLAVKKASRLIESDPDYHFRQRDSVTDMINIASEVLSEAGYRPYYLYRQKHMSGSLENVGYCKDDTYGLYNIRIMDDSQSILAIGAGAMSKRYYSDENRLERVPNVSNYEIYIERIDEMIGRKDKDFFNWR